MTIRTGKIGIGLALVALLATSACVTDPDTGQRKVSKAAIGGLGGALGGYLLGDVVGGKRDRTEKIVGAGIGALAGAGVGAYMDAQERKLREQTAGTGVDVIRDGNDLLLRMPSGITFAFDKAEVQPQFQPTLNEVASTLTQFPQTYIDIYGHTDSVGSASYNQGLSERRAQAVSNYLAMHGVQSARMATRGFGLSQPIASNDTESGRSANRRVEIKIVPLTQSDVSGS